MSFAKSRPGCAAALATCILALAAPAAAQGRSAPQMVPLPNSAPPPADTAWPGGAITLDVDATDTARALWRVTETIPVAAGTQSLTLRYPQWIPGAHEPSGNASQLVDLHFTVDGQPAAWRRDPLDVFAFQLDLPAGVHAVVARFIDTSPIQPSEGRVTMTGEMLNMQWAAMSLYPAGHYVRQIRIKPSITLPHGWSAATALDGAQQSGNHISWAETDYDTLVDSPVFAGINFKRIDLGHNVALDMVADKPEDLAISAEHIGAYRALVDEALATFGSRHFDHYDFLLALTDRLGGIGLEHHRSSENTMDAKSLVQWSDYDWARNVLAHEFSHSWDGKFRRPAKLWTPDYAQPMQDNLLWVYEGQTQFWGYVLAARAGVQSRDIILGQIASNAGMFTQWPGRGWRSVEDTTLDPVIAARQPKPFPSLARNEDYYTEGALVWLEADQIIRAGTGGAKGLDDFARAFFGVRDGDWGEVTYELGDVTAALNAIYPYDWDSFFKARISSADQPAPLAGIERAGYRLSWKDEPNPFDKARMASGKYLSLFHSLGIVIDKDGKITGCRWDSPAFNARLVSGTRIIAVNGMAYDQDGIRVAITAAKDTDKPIALIVQHGDRVETVELAYHEGLRWPWIERAPGTHGPAPLDLLLAPHRQREK